MISDVLCVICDVPGMFFFVVVVEDLDNMSRGKTSKFQSYLIAYVDYTLEGHLLVFNSTLKLNQHL